MKKLDDRKKRLVKTAKEYAKVHLKEPIINKATGWPIEIPLSGLEHSLKHDMFSDKSGRIVELLYLVRKFKILLKDATLTESVFDKKNREDIFMIHKFKVQITIKEVNENVEIVVREIIDKKKMINRKLFYNHRFIVQEIKNPE